MHLTRTLTLLQGEDDHADTGLVDRLLSGDVASVRSRPGADGRRRRLSDRTNREAAGHMRAGPTRQSHKTWVPISSLLRGPAIDHEPIWCTANPKSESGRSLHRRDGVPSLPDASDPRAGRVCARALKARPRGRALNTAGRRRANPDPRSWRRRPRAHKLQRVSRSDLWS